MSGSDRNQYLGKFRGTVVSNLDPLQAGRLLVQVPDVFGVGVSAWALPCTPYAGMGVGWYAVPPVGAPVWVEFERGNPDYPIWAGCLSEAGGIPAGVYSPEVKVLKTESCTITLNDSAGEEGFTLETAGGVKIEISDADGGVIKLTAPRVMVNGAVLAVT